MRFGIIGMQLNSLIPPGISSEDLFAHVLNFDHANLVEELVDKGFDLIELSGDLSLFLPQTFEPEAIERLKAVKQQKGLSYTIHLPLWSVEPSTPLAPVREGSVNAVIDCIRATQPLEPEIYVLHATGAMAAEFSRIQLPEVAEGFLLRQFHNNARQSITKILSVTGIPGSQLAIETIEYSFDLTLELAEELGLSICLDTGHVLVGFSGPIEIFDALEQSLPYLGEVHLHDGPWQGPEMDIGYGKDHQALGRGDLEVGRFLDRLVGSGFDGPVVFELGLESALESIELIQSIRPELISQRWN